MDRLYAMEAFVRVVESGSFTAAAESLHQSPSAMSKLIARLEDRLNVRLLQRTTRRVLPTAEGRRYYEESRALLAEVDALESSVGGAGAAGSACARRAARRRARRGGGARESGCDGHGAAPR